MPNPSSPPNNDPFNETSLDSQSLVTFLFAITAGVLAALILLPAWMPNLAGSLFGDSPKAYWYLSRSTAFIAMALLWMSMALGMLITNKMSRLWPGAPTAFAIHEYTSLLGLGFATFHVLILLGDHYANYSLAQLLIPFAAGSYRPLWVGLGQLGFYVWMLVAFSFYVRQRIGQKTWRLIHFASFFMYMVALFHGLSSGTDSTALWAQWFYWLSGGSLLFLLMYRLTNIASATIAPQKA